MAGLIKLTDNRSNETVLVGVRFIHSVKLSRNGATVVSVGSSYDLWVRETPDEVWNMVNKEIEGEHTC